jgi:hypothetical protein
MCDYSLAHVPNRLAVEGERLVVHHFASSTLVAGSRSCDAARAGKLRMVAHGATLHTARSPIANQMHLISRPSTERTMRDYWSQTHAPSGCQLGFRFSSV